jgi:GAF domain-containing protein
MPRFEVYVPPAPPKLPVALTLRVESENWLAALKVGLQKVGGGELAANILCDIQSDGSVLLGRFQAGDLAFGVARGPKGDEIVRRGLAVPWGRGIVGSCAQENVCLAVSDAEKDPRFYRDVSEAVGYATRSALCAPIASGGRVRGAMELLNKGAGAFDPADIAVLSYLAHKAGELLERVD